MRHPIFARAYALLSRHESELEVDHRRSLLAGASGSVIEIGAGSGANFAHYPPTVTRVIAVEPEPYLRRQAMKAAGAAPVAVEVREGSADALPGADGQFDIAVFSLVLCTVPDPRRALAEARRVMRADGALRFYEHVVARRPATARLQRLLDRTFWPHVAGGCHTARDTERAIEDAGFRVERCERSTLRPVPVAPAVPHILGIARPA